MDKHTLKNIDQSISTTIKILDCFESKNDKVSFRLKCLKTMLETVEPFGDFYPVSEVYSKLSESLGSNKFAIRGIFVKLCQAGLLKRETISFALTSDMNVTIDAFCLTAKAFELLG